MKEKEIKEMLNDIINNNAKYEGRPKFCSPGGAVLEISEKNCSTCHLCEALNKWTPYKLGEEIHPKWIYRKVEKWYVVKCNKEKPFMCINQEHLDMHFLSTDIVFESNSKKVCEEWIEEHKTWLDKNYPLNEDFPYDDFDINETRVSAIEDFVKEFLSRVYKESKEYNDSDDTPFTPDYIDVEDLENIIKEMGVNV